MNINEVFPLFLVSALAKDGEKNIHVEETAPFYLFVLSMKTWKLYYGWIYLFIFVIKKKSNFTNIYFYWPPSPSDSLIKRKMNKA